MPTSSLAHGLDNALCYKHVGVNANKGYVILNNMETENITYRGIASK